MPKSPEAAAKHRIWMRTYTQEKRAGWRQAGLCLGCGKRKPVFGALKCRPCQKKQNQSNSRISKQRAEKGICLRCKVRESEPTRKTCATCRSDSLARRQQERALVLAHYGNKCTCCGEAQPEFLQVDHINNDGAQHRKEVPKSQLYRWLRKNGYPDRFQLLCANCNFAKGHYGMCPHQKQVK